MAFFKGPTKLMEVGFESSDVFVGVGLGYSSGYGILGVGRIKERGGLGGLRFVCYSSVVML